MQNYAVWVGEKLQFSQLKVTGQLRSKTSISLSSLFIKVVNGMQIMLTKVIEKYE